MYRELIVPSDEELRELLIEVRPVKEMGVRTLVASAQDHSEIEVTWDVFGRSIFVRARFGVTSLIEITRESATRINIQQRADSVYFRLEFESDGLNGSLNIVVGEDIKIEDTLLFK